MVGLHNITGYWYKNEDKDLWEGQLLLHEDGWFEGIVEDISAPDDNIYRLIFGSLEYFEKILLFKIPSREASNSLVFHGTTEKQDLEDSLFRYDAHFHLITDNSEKQDDAGVCHLLTNNEAVRQKSKIRKVQKSINDFKATMDDSCKDLYALVLDMRSRLTNQFDDTSNGIILEGFRTLASVNQKKSVDEYCDLSVGVKKLVKQMKSETDYDGVPF